MKLLTSVTLETEETIVLREGKAVVQGTCPRFDSPSVLATPEAFSILVAISEREIFRLIEKGELCFVEADRVLICLQCFQRSTEANAAARTADTDSRYVLPAKEKLPKDKNKK